MTTLVAQESTFEPVNEGIHAAMFSGWEGTKAGLYGPGIKIIWNLVDEPDKANGDPADLWQFVSQKLTPKSKLWGMLKGLGRTPVLGETYELDALLDPCVGQLASLVVKHEDGPNGPRAKVLDVLPPPKGR